MILAIVAFVVGAVVGFFTMALLAISSTDDQESRG